MRKITLIIIIFSLLLTVCYAQDAKEQEALFIAQKAFDDGFYDVSEGLLERFLNNYPDSKKASEASLLIGQCYFHQNKFLEALNKFEGLLSKPGALEIQDAVIYWIAEVNFRANNFSKAGEFYKKIVDSYFKSSYLPVSLYSLGWCFFQEQKFAKALDCFKTIEEKFPRQNFAQDAGFKIIECLYNLKDYAGLKEKSKGYLKIYSKDSAKSAYLYFYLGEADYYLENLEDAAKEYNQAVVLSADEKIGSLAKLGAGWSYLKLNKYKEAENIFSELNPQELESSGQGALLLGKAVLFAQTKSFAKARDAYQQIIDSAQDLSVLIQAYLGQADAYYNMAEYKQAAGVYKQALAKSADRTPQEMVDKLHYGLAWALLKDGEFKNAIEEFKKVVKSSDDKIVKVSALCQIGDTYQDSGDFNKAVATYDTILKDYSDSIYGDYVQYQLGLTLLKASNYDGAILAFKTLKVNYPESKLLDDATYALGLAYFQREDYNSSKDVLEKFSSLYQGSNLAAEAMYLLGTSYYNLGNFEGAINVFKDLIRLFPLNIELIQKCEYEIADCFYRMGKEKEAMEKFKQLRVKYPDSRLTPEVMWWLGEYYYRHNDLILARRYFSSLIQDFSSSSLIPDAYYALGASFAEESKYLEAISNFRKVLEYGKSDLAGTAAIAIADIYLKQQNYDLALENYNYVLESRPNLAHLIYPKIGEVYFKMNNYLKAIEFYRKSLDLVPVREIGSIQFKIAEAQEASSNFDAAVEDYLKVSYLYTENSALVVKALLRVAAIYLDKDNYKEALNIYKRVALMDVEEAKYALEKIDWLKTQVK